MKQIKLYPPKGGEPIIPHPSKVQEMLDKGWLIEPVKKVKSKKEDK